jgi:hypothetical protein
MDVLPVWGTLQKAMMSSRGSVCEGAFTSWKNLDQCQPYRRAGWTTLYERKSSFSTVQYFAYGQFAVCGSRADHDIKS